MQSHARKSSKSFAYRNKPVRDAVPFVDAFSRDETVLERFLESGSDSTCGFRRLDGLVEQERLSNVLYLGNCALEVECFGQDDLEDLWNVSLSCLSSANSWHTF